MNERRKFLVQGIAALGAIGLNRRLPGAEAAPARLSAARFDPHVNHAFSFFDSRSGARTRMTLVAVRRVPSGRNVEQFSLVFRGRPGVTLAEGCYRVVGGPARRSELFITPTPGQDGVTHYRADFGILA